MSNKSPLQQVNDEHGGKNKLVDKIVDLVDRDGEDKAEYRSRLQSAPNSKLLRLHRVSAEVKDRFGNKEALVNAVLDLLKRGKDQDYRAKLVGFTPTKLLSMHRDLEKKAKSA